MKDFAFKPKGRCIKRETIDELLRARAHMLKQIPLQMGHKLLDT